MQNQAFEPRRTPEGAIDIGHYAGQATAERRAVRAATMKIVGRATRRTIVAVIAIVAFWNIPPMGNSTGSKDTPYR